MGDYKQKYKQAIKRAKAVNPGTADYNIITEIFPELKESDDLKIKRDIQYAVRCAYGDNSNNTNSILAWLEKQGEKIDAIENFDTEFKKQVSYLIASTINKEYEYNEGFVKLAANALLNYAKHELEKQGEQKPTDKVKPKFKVGDCIRHKGTDECYKIVTIDDNYYFCENSHAWAIRSQGYFELVEQNPAWSEEDEEMIAAVIADIQFTQKAHIHEVNQVVYEREIDWLKSLKERMKGE